MVPASTPKSENAFSLRVLAPVVTLQLCNQVRSLKFKPGLKRVARTNGSIQCIEGDFTAPEQKAWDDLFVEVRRGQDNHRVTRP